MGKLIVFEGIDGAGKATQVEHMAKRLRADGKYVTTFKSPRYETPTGQIVLDALRGMYGDFVGLSPYLSAVPYLLDFAAMRDELQDALTKGPVVCDRYVPSTVAYHSAKLTGESAEKFTQHVERIAYEQVSLPRPDAIVYLHVPVETARRLMEHKNKDQHERNTAYQARVAHTYTQLAKRKDWHTIECVTDTGMRSIKDIAAEIEKVVG